MAQKGSKKGLGPSPKATAQGSGSKAPQSQRSASVAKPSQPSRSGQAQAIPREVSNRMARRIAVATGVPTVMGMGVFIGSYLLVSRGIAAIEPAATLVASGACFLLGLLGLSYGVLSASWEAHPGSLLGFEQLGVNIGRVRRSLRPPAAGN